MGRSIENRIDLLLRNQLDHRIQVHSKVNHLRTVRKGCSDDIDLLLVHSQLDRRIQGQVSRLNFGHLDCFYVQSDLLVAKERKILI